MKSIRIEKRPEPAPNKEQIHRAAKQPAAPIESSLGNQAIQNLVQQNQIPMTKPGDSLESEADRFAQSVAAKNSLSPSAGLAPADSPQLASADPKLVSQDQGRTLESSTQAAFAPFLQKSPEHVRIHDSDSARQTAKNVNARAFTCGADIWLGPGEQETDTSLLAHELKHVEQQASMGRPMLMRQPINSMLPSNVELNRVGLSFQIPGGKALTDDWNDLSTTNPTTVSLSITATGLHVSFSPSLLIDAQWPVSDMEWSDLTYDFATARISSIGLVSTQDVAYGGQATARSKISAWFLGLLSATSMATAGYDPLSDPDPRATLNAIKTNFESAPSSGSEVTAADVTAVTLSATITLRTPITEGTDERRVVIGGSVTISAELRGNAAEIGQASTPSIEALTISGTSIIVQKDGADVAQIHELTVHPGGSVTVGSITLLGAARQAAGIETTGRFLGLMLLLGQGQPSDRLAVANLEPRLEAEIVPGLTRAALNQALTQAMRQLIIDNAGAIPGYDLKTIFGVSELGDFPIVSPAGPGSAYA